MTVLAGGAAAQSISGTVRDASNVIPGATVRAERADHAVSRDAVTDSDGRFRIGPLQAGLYYVTARRLGYRTAELLNVRVADGQTVQITVLLTQAPRQLSTISVVTSPTAIDASTTALNVRLDRQFTALLPSARDASSLIALIPGARQGQLWGGAPGVSNNYQLDGVAVNHPGLGGDFLGLSIDWIDALEVRGLGAGAEQGNFQGGVINAVTRTGTNDRRQSLRTNYESQALTATNISANEEGIEQASRREVGGEALGPILRDRLFYFLGGQFVQRDMRSPNLTTSALDDFLATQEARTNARGIAKVTWLSGVGQRVDVIGGFTSDAREHSGINGVDDASATVRLRQPTTYYEIAWNNSSHPRHVFDVRLGGFNATASQLGYHGTDVPGVQVLQIGRMPSYQNPAFDEIQKPSSISANLSWRTIQHAFGADHELVLGSELTRGRWIDNRTRNGGMTWRPYGGAPTFDPFNAATWRAVGSDWGGEMHLDSDTRTDAVYAQDYATLGARVTVTPGVRLSRWVGYIRPNCGGIALPDCARFEAVRDVAADPRIGIVWDVTGRNTLALRAHWGRYHQAMYSLFFDRVRGANVYSDARFYYSAPPLSTTTQTFSPPQRDAPGSGFSPYYDVLTLSESGRVQAYHQPYVDQTLLSAEKTFGPAWKAELVYTHRRNANIVGLVDRNLDLNYSPIYDVSVDHRFIQGQVLDAHGNRLVIPVVFVSNADLYHALHSCGDSGTGPCGAIAGYTAADPLYYDQDIVLSTIPYARRRYDQITATLRTVRDGMSAEGSLTGARLRGNVAGVAGFGTAGNTFTAGPFVRPNESINAFGYLPGALQIEGKVWVTARLPASMQGGLLYTHVLGERFTPSFDILGRYQYTDRTGAQINPAVFRSVLGQSIFLEPRGSRRLASRDVVDAHLEWRATRHATVQLDLFNAGGANAITLINENIGDQDERDPTSVFGAPRMRVAPRSLRIGLRLDN
ncbi:MAG TPA: TonB-dependent receptor [Gemmatimonadaceae bacterium]|nr:TonB-dependent receptor [Gemmatimonadaceae bacterium]